MKFYKKLKFGASLAALSTANLTCFLQSSAFYRKFVAKFDGKMRKSAKLALRGMPRSLCIGGWSVGTDAREFKVGVLFLVFKSGYCQILTV